MSLTAHLGSRIFDGESMHANRALVVSDGRILAISPPDRIPSGCREARHDGGTILPGFVDLQVNGGGGRMLGDDPSPETIAAIAAAHAASGTLGLMPTLVTDTPDRARSAVEATLKALDAGVPGVLGLHLEGPHLAPARAGAHDPGLIRPMADEDEEFLVSAARRLPNLMVTLAPESTGPDRIARLAAAGVIVALGHSDCTYDDAVAAFASGARVTTHLFNAMSQMGSRTPGLAGAALDSPGVTAGLIADGVHVHPATIRVALKAARGRVMLVTDAMATAGSDIRSFDLNGRVVRRADGRLTLEDGSLAGGDLDMPRAIRNMRGSTDLEEAGILAMATSVPADVLRNDFGHGRLAPGRPARAIHVSDDWRAATRIA